MGRKPARMIAGMDHDPRDRPAAARAAGRCGRLGMLALAAAAGLALLPSAMSTAPAARPAIAAHSAPSFDPCPCADPVCKPVCSQL